MKDPDSLDVPGAVLDEIALEGLDGITLSALWQRLAGREGFPVKLDDNSKAYLFEVVKLEEEVKAFLLKEPRKPLVIFVRSDYNAMEGSYTSVDMPEEIYPNSPVDDTVNHIRGSCASYYTRVDITPEFQSTNFKDALEKWGERLVFVASQRARNQALTGSASILSPEVGLNHYVLLERIGRSRRVGLSTHEKEIGVLNIPPKTVFYFRKKLVRLKLIIKQHVGFRLAGRYISASLLHLTRFATYLRPRMLTIGAQVIEMLVNAPKHMLIYSDVNAVIASKTHSKKLFSLPQFRKYVLTDERVPHRTLFPDAPMKEWKNKNGSEKTIRVLMLRSPDTKPEDIFQDDEAEEDEDDEGGFGILNQSELKSNMTLTRQGYQLIKEAGGEGLSQNQLGSVLGLSKLDSRTVCRALTRSGQAKTYFKDQGKQRCCMFYASCFGESGESHVRMKSEKEKFVSLLTSTVGDAEPKLPAIPSRSVTPISSLAGDESQSVKLENVSDAGTPSKTTLDDSVGVFEESVEDDFNLVADQGNLLKSLEVGTMKSRNELSLRFIKRANIIMQAINEGLVIESPVILERLITQEEAKEGIKERMDRKSLQRILQRLAKDRHLKNMKVVLKSEDKEKVLHFICHPSITADNSVIRSAVEQAKLKFLAPSREMLNFMQQMKESETREKALSVSWPESAEVPSTDTLKSSVMELKELTTVPQAPLPALDAKPWNRAYGRQYGIEPKFIRMRELHKFLFYLTYAYGGDTTLDQSEAVAKLKEQEPSLAVELPGNLPRLYRAEVHWAMFVPPLPQHQGWPTGWCFFCDVLLRTPLSLFVKLVLLSFKIDGLEEWLQHPVKQHYLIYQLPLHVRQLLLFSRKYLFSIHEVATRLCFVGLLQFGPRSLKEKDQVFMFVNRRAKILDTTISGPGYHKITPDITYQSREYYFAKEEDLSQYWYDVWTICMNTPLGGYSCAQGSSIVLEVLDRKQSLTERLQARLPEEAPLHDTGVLPGDQLGAAGYDAAFFAHLKRNWSHTKMQALQDSLSGSNLRKDWLSSITGGSQNVVQQIPGRLPSLKKNLTIAAEKPVLVTRQPNVPHTSKGIPRMKQKLAANTTAIGNASSADVHMSRTVKRRKPDKVVRLVQRKLSRQRKPYYDDVDKAALKAMDKLRVDWNASEDAFLLLCKIAGTYIMPHGRSQMISFLHVRDLLHSRIPESKNKTSRACQRRMLYMMKNPSTAYNLAMVLEEIQRNPEVEKLIGPPMSAAERSKMGRDKANDEVASRFKKLALWLADNWSSTATCHGFQLPLTINEFKNRFVISIPKGTIKQRKTVQEVQNTTDIRSRVIYNVIHSSLCCSKEKTSWNHQLFRIYEQYPDTLLRSTFAKMRAEMILTVRKQRGFSKRKAPDHLPLSSNPYKLSSSYVHLFLTRYQYAMFGQCITLLNSVLHPQVQPPKISELPSTTENVLPSTSGENVTGENSQEELPSKSTETPKRVSLPEEQDFEFNAWGTCLTDKRMPGGYAAMIVSMMCNHRLVFTTVVPDQIIVMDPTLNSNLDHVNRVMERYKTLMTVTEKPTVEIEGQDEEISKDKEILDGSVSISSKRKAIEDLQSDKVKKPRSMEPSDEGVSNSATISAIRFEGESTGEKRVQKSSLLKSSSRLALHMMREEMAEKTEGPEGLRAQHLIYDFYVLNQCKVYFRLRTVADFQQENTAFSSYQPFELVTKELETQTIRRIQTLLPCPAPALEDIKKLYEEQRLSFGEIEDAVRIMDLITQAQEMGVTGSQLKERIGSLRGQRSLVQHVIFLVETGYLVRVGVACTRLVATVSAATWAVRSFRLLRLQKEKLPPPQRKYYVAGEEEPKEAKDDVTTEKETEINRELSATETEALEVASEAVEEMDTSFSKGVKEAVLEICDEEVADARPDEKEKEEGIRRSSRKKKERKDSETAQTFEPKENIFVLVRPWVRIDGTINRKVLNRMLGALLSHVMLKPGITIAELGERFAPVIEITQARELVEILETLGCLKQFKVQKGVASLFSDPLEYSLGDVDILESESVIRVETTGDGLVRLSEFIGEHTADQDYIPFCECHTPGEV